MISFVSSSETWRKIRPSGYMAIAGPNSQWPRHFVFVMLYLCIKPLVFTCSLSFFNICSEPRFAQQSSISSGEPDAFASFRHFSLMQTKIWRSYLAGTNSIDNNTAERIKIKQLPIASNKKQLLLLFFAQIHKLPCKPLVH